MSKNLSDRIKLALSLAIPLGIGIVGSLFTYPNVSTWYADLAKPWFNPPSWLFGPVWTTLYILIGVSLYLVWRQKGIKSKKLAFSIFGIQITLNLLWSIVFFGLHAPWAAVVVIVALVISIFANMKLFWNFSKPAAYLLIPYLAWVGFATALNIAIATLN